MGDMDILLAVSDVLALLASYWARVHLIRTRRLALSGVAFSLLYVAISLGTFRIALWIQGYTLFSLYVNLLLWFLAITIHMFRLIKKASRLGEAVL